MDLIKKRDFIVIAVVLLMALGIYLFYQGTTKDGPVMAEIYYESKLVKTVELTNAKEESFFVPEVEPVIFHQYKDGSISFFESDCPDKVCISSGRLKTAGQSAACLPNKLILKIVPIKGSSEDVDMIG